MWEVSWSKWNLHWPLIIRRAFNQKETKAQKLEIQQRVGKLRPGWLEGGLNRVIAGGKEIKVKLD